MNLTFSKRWAVGLQFLVLAVAAWGVLSPQDALAQALGAGTFQGILQSDSNNDESFGFITLALTGTGAFSMRFNLGVNHVGHHSYVKSGRFDAEGHYHFEGPDPNDTRYAVARIIDLQLDSLEAPTRITGEVTDFTHSSTIEMEKIVVPARGSSVAETGVYTFLIENSDLNVPHGTGFGRATVSRSGRILASGRSGDGRTFQQSANLTVFNRWPVFAKMAGNTKGILAGWMTFQETAESDFTGNLEWLGPEVPGPNNAFVPEFSGTVSATGSRYAVTSGTSVLALNSSTNNVHLNLSHGGMEVPIDRTVTLSSRNRFYFSPKLPGDALMVAPANGLFSGSFTHNDGRRYRFQGAILQKQNRGAGEFLNSEGLPGNVTLTPE